MLYELPTPAPATAALDCSSLPTPKAADGERGRDLARLRPDTQSRELATALTQLPTPRAALGEQRNQTIYKRKGVDNWQGSRLNLENALALLPTPAVNDMGAGKDPNAWQEWAARQKASDGRPAPHGKSLEQEALALLPTPRVAADRTSRSSMVDAQQWSAPSLAQALEIAQGILPREFKDWSEVPGHSGASTPPLFADGKPSSDDLLQPLPFDGLSATD